jgi:hypothetical protein
MKGEDKADDTSATLSSDTNSNEESLSPEHQKLLFEEFAFDTISN